MCKNWAITVFAVLCFSLVLQAQTKSVDVVYLKSGEKYTGEIIRYEQGVKVVLRQADGKEIELADANIKRIVQGVAEDGSVQAFTGKKEKIILAKTRGLYNSTLLSFAMGSANDNGLALGAGVSNVTGYQFKWLGAGIGIGLDNYARRGETLYPVFLEFRGLIPSKKPESNYYIVAAGGYGFAFKRENVDITSAEGGFMAHPAVGYRVATTNGLDVNVDLGIKFQKAQFTRTLFNGDVEIRDILYRRFVLRIGLTLWK